MNSKELTAYCLTKKGAYIDFPFGEGYLCVKVKGKLFAQIFVLRGESVATLNCDSFVAQYYRQKYPEFVARGWHVPPVSQHYFNTVKLNGGVSDEELQKMVDHSYAYVTAKLPKRLQKELFEE